MKATTLMYSLKEYHHFKYLTDDLSFKDEREHLMGKSQVCKRNDSGHFSVHLQHRMTRSGPLVHQMVQFWHVGSQNVGSQNALSIFQTNT